MAWMCNCHKPRYSRYLCSTSGGHMYSSDAQQLLFEITGQYTIARPTLYYMHVVGGSAICLAELLDFR